MSRLHRVIHAVASSYILLIATALYSLCSVPVALHYLDTSRFGLWVVMGTLANYLNLIDAGMSGASGRLMIDVKDDMEGSRYGELIKTIWLVSTSQGAIIFLIGLLLAKPFAYIMVIPGKLSAEFVELFVWQCGVLALSFGFRTYSTILGAHQRMDVCNYAGLVGMILNFGTQWVFFHLGYGVISLAFGSLAATLASAIIQGYASIRLNLLPHPGHWGRVSWSGFRELFLYGKDLFLASLGTQLIRASPAIVITRTLGIEVAATWGVGTRLFTLLTQVVWRLTDMTGGAFAEMMVRGEAEQLRRRYISLFMLTFSLAGWVGISFAFTNSLFVEVWTHGKIDWPAQYDLMLSILLMTSTMIHCHNYFILNTRRVALLPYIYFAEGSVFVASSFLLVRWGGISAILASSIICGILFSGAYGIFRISRYFQLPVLTVALGWLGPLCRMSLWYLPIAAASWWMLSAWSTPHRLAIQGVLAATVGAFTFLRFGIPASVQVDVASRIPFSILRLIGWRIR